MRTSQSQARQQHTTLVAVEEEEQPAVLSPHELQLLEVLSPLDASGYVVKALSGSHVTHALCLALINETFTPQQVVALLGSSHILHAEYTFLQVRKVNDTI
jgi:hypothetical protein